MSAPTHGQFPIIGLATLMRAAYAGQSLSPAWDALVARVANDPADAGALMDMSIILQLTGQRDRGLAMQKLALQEGRVFRQSYGNGAGLRVLAISAPGDFMVNTPIDFLLEGSDFELLHMYVDVDSPVSPVIPVHDVCFLAISESAQAEGVLARTEDILRRVDSPILNGVPERIMALSRPGLFAMFDNDPLVVVPRAVRYSRERLEAIQQTGELSGLLPEDRLPIIIRPVSSHAGNGLSKLDSVDDLRRYLHEQSEDAFMVGPFIDYRSADGMFRKYRVAFINGRPFISHMAVSSRWMVHYLNAEMETNTSRREDEAEAFASFQSGFATRHRDALAHLCRRVGLDYFAIDCAELPSGQLLCFEADVAMIVHALDPEQMFPYKKPAMTKIFAAFQTNLAAASR